MLPKLILSGLQTATRRATAVKELVRATSTRGRCQLILAAVVSVGLGGAPRQAYAQTPAQAAPEPAGGGGTEIILLGTRGGPGSDERRSQPSSLFKVNGTSYLIDVGDGTSRQLAGIGMTPLDIRTIFITHHHLDHTAGLAPLIALSWIRRGLAGANDAKTAVYGPPSTQALVTASLGFLSTSERIFRDGIPSLPTARPMFSGHDFAKNGLIFRDENIRVTAVENAHFHHQSSVKGGQRDMSFSYRFDTPNGSVVFTGDTGPSDAVTELAKGADILVSEVFMPRETPPPGSGSNTALQAQLLYHLTQEHLLPEEVGKMATKAGVKTVILTHYVPATDPAPFVAAVKKHFKGNVIGGTDLMRIDLATGDVKSKSAD
jgi:ribonuclease BN (tRNA processing enzyme)